MSSVSLPAELADELRARARANGRTLAGEARFALRAYLDAPPPKRSRFDLDEVTGGVTRAELADWLAERGWSLNGWNTGNGGSLAKFMAAKTTTGTVQTARTVEQLRGRVTAWEEDNARRGATTAPHRPTVVHGLVGRRLVSSGPAVTRRDATS